MSLTFPIDAKLKDDSPVQLVLAGTGEKVSGFILPVTLGATEQRFHEGTRIGVM